MTEQLIINKTLGTLKYSAETPYVSDDMAEDAIDYTDSGGSFSGGAGSFRIRKPGEGAYIVEAELFPLFSFSFTLTHGDGTTITQASGLLSNIKIYNSSQELISTRTEWDSHSDRWIVTLLNEDDYDPNGHFAVYNTRQFGLSTQYPYRYKAADKWDSADLILDGIYSDTIPYWCLGRTINDSNFSGDCTGDEEPEYLPLDYAAKWVTSWSMQRTLKTSVPYKATYTLLEAFGGLIYKGHERTWALPIGGGYWHEWFPDCSKPMTRCYYRFSQSREEAWVQVTSDDGILNVFDNDTPLVASGVVDVSEYTESVKSITLTSTSEGTVSATCYNIYIIPPEEGGGAICIDTSTYDATYVYSWYKEENELSMNFEYDW